MRIVSLLPSATEILCALGLEQHLVAISHECDYPPSVASLPRITQSILQQGLNPKEIDDAVRAANLDEQPLYSIDAEKLIALEPDLIVTQGVCAVCAVAEETVHQSLSFARVETVSAASVLSLEGLDLDGIEADIRKLGELSNHETAFANHQTLRKQRLLEHRLKQSIAGSSERTDKSNQYFFCRKHLLKLALQPFGLRHGRCYTPIR